MQSTVETTGRRVTSLGTPCAGSWDDAWIALVDWHEAEAGRRICGARTVGGTPCMSSSDHASGRCLHHGGVESAGAPEGNRNADVHGLYSRRLTDCGIDGPLEL